MSGYYGNSLENYNKKSVTLFYKRMGAMEGFNQRRDNFISKANNFLKGVPPNTTCMTCYYSKVDYYFSKSREDRCLADPFWDVSTVKLELRVLGVMVYIME